jgi:hypothetical protein
LNEKLKEIIEYKNKNLTPNNEPVYKTINGIDVKVSFGDKTREEIYKEEMTIVKQKYSK